MNHATFIQQLVSAVKYSPIGSKRCDRINTFAFLDDGNQINDENLGMTIRDRGTNFFSISWEQQGNDPNSLKWDYPLLAVVLIGTTIEQPFRTNKVCPTNIREYDLIVVDKLEDQAAANSNPCQQRSKNDLIVECTNLLNGVFDYINQVIYAEVDGGEDGYYTQGLLDQMVTDGDITAYMKIDRESNSFIRDLRERNANSNGVAFSDRGVYGIRNPILVSNKVKTSPVFDYTQGYDKVLTSFGNENVKR